MTTVLEPPASHDAPRQSWPVRSLRFFLGLALLALCGLMVVEALAVRAIEAVLAEPLVRAVTTGDTSTLNEVILFGLGTSDPTGLRITAECTVIIMVVPIGVVVSLLLMFSRVSMIRLLAGGVIGALAAILVNQLRIALIAFSTQEWGMDPGYEVSHKFVGSVLAIIGFTLAFLILAKIIAKDPSRTNRKRSAA
ncbi:exosortase/archaeosortase family protein [Saccharomonospora sp. NPDC046836]|uniref:exosortase/archaeosortase family protein n=1 Tax=Saccharomonospora sp. NPDC046836 TaxID=3156921 RepID=UPI0033CEE0FE